MDPRFIFFFSINLLNSSVVRTVIEQRLNGREEQSPKVSLGKGLSGSGQQQEARMHSYCITLRAHLGLRTTLIIMTINTDNRGHTSLHNFHLFQIL